jgi:hypothetical protein
MARPRTGHLEEQPVTAWIVEARATQRLSPMAARRLRDRLSSCQAILTVEEDSWTLRLQLEAEDAAAAVAQLLALLDAGASIVRAEATTIAEWERRLSNPQLPDLVGIVDIQEMAGLRTKQRALQVTELAGFPQPALKTRAGRLWTREGVEAFLGRWPRRLGRPPGRQRPSSSSGDRSGE